MHKWLILLFVVLLLLAAGVVAYVALVPEPGDLTPTQRAHLQAEAERLAADPTRIRQEDAAWIAQRLGPHPTADELVRLGDERWSYLNQQHAKKLKSDYPDLWFAWERKTVDENGYDKLQAAGELAKLVWYEARFETLTSNAATVVVSEELRTEYLAETEPVMEAFRDASASKLLVLNPPRMNSFLDTIESPAGYQAFRVLSVRVRLLAEAGLIGQAQDEMDLLMEVYSRVDWDLYLIGVIMHAIASDFLLRYAALPLVETGEVATCRAQRWLELAGRVQRDVVYSIGVDLIQTAHINVTDPYPTFVRATVRDFGEGVTLSPLSVEDMFSAVRRNQAVALDVCRYLHSDHESRLTPEGQLQAARAFERAHFLVLSNLRDDVEARFAWAALDLRIAELETGPLADHPEVVEEVLKRWPAIRVEWHEDSLQLWCRTEYCYRQKPTECLIELSRTR
ncbi:MAG: hypothetical protein KDB68_05290 [Planctomycetes bacterium]|nr:hypothetical protein [Planctomycetota bacterium]MCA8946366.1 hypothetical protein [Planctomycetota bacterium]